MPYEEITSRKCAFCGKMIPAEAFEGKIEGKELVFCDERHARRYKEELHVQG